MGPAARRELVDAARAEDPELGRELEELLAHDARPFPEIDDASATSGAAVPGVELLARALAEPEGGAPGAAAPPARIGRYSIRGVIGEGGMGIVYEAEQDDPHRRVALKVIRGGMVTRTMLQRFRHEAQVLGQLKHPGIAQIYEAGTMDGGQGGQPWFAMELVEGPPLLESARARRLGIRARVELMAMVCDAVHHAHQKGVIHRDLKPANILVAETGTGPLGQPKILDFGVARATNADIQAVTLQTDAGQIVGTLPYMSPEQAAGDPADLDVRSDVYSLGVVMYELLAGRLPYAVQGKLLPETLRLIREQEPSRLSSIDHRLRGDVDTICRKALEKSKERRYQSAAEMAADLRRHLDDEPILARPASAFHQWRRFARRNKGTVTGVGAAFGVLLIATIVSLRLAVVAERAREGARHEALIARLAAAASAIDGRDPVSARESLEAVPAGDRNWEWRYQAARLDQSEGSLDIGEPLRSAFFAPGAEEFLAVSNSGSLWRWNPESGVAPSRVRLEGGPTGPVALSHDGRFLAGATGAGRALALWSAADGAREAEYALPVAETDESSLHRTRVALSPDGSRIAAIAGNKSAFLLESIPLAGRAEARLVGHHGLDLAISRDGRRIVATRQDKILFFDAADGTELAAFHIPDLGAPTVVEFVGESDRVAFSIRKRIWLCDPPQTPGMPERLVPLDGHIANVTALAADPSGRWLASGSEDMTIRVWDVQAEAPVATLTGHAAAVEDVEFDATGDRVLSASADGTVRVWSRERGESAAVLRGHRSYVYPVAFTPDGRRIVSGAWDGDLRVWDAAGGECIAVLTTGEPLVTSLAISRDGSLIASGHPEGRVQVRDSATGRLTHELATRTPETINSLAFEHGSSALLARGVRELSAIALAPKRGAIEPLIQPEPWTVEQKGAVACSPVAPLVAVARHDGTVRILDRRAGKEVLRLERPRGAAAPGLFFALAFSPDGARLAGGCADGNVYIWNAHTGAAAGTLSGHRGPVYALAYSPDGSRLASGSDDTTIRIWAPATGRQVALLPGHDEYVFSLAFSPDGETLASASGDWTLRIWDTKPMRLRRSAAARMCARRDEARPLAAGLLADLGDPQAVAARLRSDASLDPDAREAALQALLQIAVSRPVE